MDHPTILNGSAIFYSDRTTASSFECFHAAECRKWEIQLIGAEFSCVSCWIQRSKVSVFVSCKKVCIFFPRQTSGVKGFNCSVLGIGRFPSNYWVDWPTR